MKLLEVCCGNLDSVRAATDPHKVMINVTGGEPLMRPDLEACGRMMYEKEMARCIGQMVKNLTENGEMIRCSMEHAIILMAQNMLGIFKMVQDMGKEHIITFPEINMSANGLMV